MPGAFAHMIAADRAKTILEEKGLMYAATVLNRFPEWMQSGAVGPDYPYLHHIISSHDKSDNWADLMHYSRTGDVVREGVKMLSSEYHMGSDKSEFMRSFSWLLGYASHVILDASIHPVVREIVGEYDDNKTDHRVCEMYMDSFIYKETYDVELTNSEWADYLNSLNDEGGMDDVVVSLWLKMLKKTYPEEFESNPPEINKWHNEYVKKLDGADLNVGFFRHAAGKFGLLYVPSNDIPESDYQKYIEKDSLPSNNRFGKNYMHYREVFELGMENVADYWEMIVKAVCDQKDIDLPELMNWNLDKGTLISKEDGDATLWV